MLCCQTITPTLPTLIYSVVNLASGRKKGRGTWTSPNHIVSNSGLKINGNLDESRAHYSFCVQRTSSNMFPVFSLG